MATRRGVIYISLPGDGVVSPSADPDSSRPGLMPSMNQAIITQEKQNSLQSTTYMDYEHNILLFL